MLKQPSMGGIGKTTLIKEIDSLGGAMPVVADQSSVHHRVLNEKKGRAVQGHREQIDRQVYQTNMVKYLKTLAPYLTIVEGT